MTDAIDLTPFCGRETHRSYPHAPFSIGAHTYATNGHRAIRVARRADVPEGGDVPNSIVQIFALADAREFGPFTLDVRRADVPACPGCRGRGWGGACETCRGSGRHDCDCDYCERGCEDCDGSGIDFERREVPEDQRVLCEACDGTGCERDDRKVHFPDGLVIAARYLALVADLPGPLAMNVPPPGEPSRFGPQYLNHGPQFFRCDGGTVAIMPIHWCDPKPGDIVVDEAGTATTVPEKQTEPAA